MSGRRTKLAAHVFVVFGHRWAATIDVVTVNGGRCGPAFCSVGSVHFDRPGRGLWQARTTSNDICMICDLGRQSVPDLSNTADDLRATHGYMLHS